WTQRKNQVLGTLDQTQIEDASSICAISDRELIYLSLNERPDRAYRSDLYLSMPVNGPLFAIDRNGDGILWETSAENQHLLLDHLSRLPVLVLLSRHATMARPEINAQQVHLELLDKWAGRHLLDKSRYVSVGSFRSMAVDLTARIIDFHG